MSRKTLINLIIIFFLLLSFPSLWYYNQRILNNRKFFTLDANFSLNKNTEKVNDLFSVTQIIQLLNKNSVPAKLSAEIDSSEKFAVMGRKILTEEGIIEVYEYSSNKDAVKKFDSFDIDAENTEKIYVYKNLILQYKDETGDIEKIMKGSIDEKMD